MLLSSLWLLQFYENYWIPDIQYIARVRFCKKKVYSALADDFYGSTWIPDCWRWKISALFEPQLHNAHACNFYRDPFLSKNSLALPFTWRGGRWTPALARTTSLRKSVLPFMWLLPGLLPQQEFLLCRKVFCHSCDFYLGACLCKISFATWKCSAILVTSTIGWLPMQELLPLSKSVVLFMLFLPGSLTIR